MATQATAQPEAPPAEPTDDEQRAELEAGFSLSEQPPAKPAPVEPSADATATPKAADEGGAEKAPAEKTPEAVTAEGGEDEKQAETPALVRALELAKARSEPAPSEEAPPAPEPKPGEPVPAAGPPAQPAEPPAPLPAIDLSTPIGPRDVERLLKVSENIFADRDYDEDDPRAPLKEYERDFPEAAQYQRVVAARMVEAMRQQMARELNTTAEALKAEMPTVTDYGEDLVQLREQVSEYQWWDAIQQGFYTEKGEFITGHPDARKISQQQDFKDWLDKANPLIRRMAEDPNSTPEEAVNILDAYKEYVTQQERAQHDETARKKKETYDRLHTGSKGAAPAAPQTDTGAAHDFKAGFNTPPRD